ncbi:MAG: signal peptidase I [Elainellaceae cyanobacterium]
MSIQQKSSDSIEQPESPASSNSDAQSQQPRSEPPQSESPQSEPSQSEPSQSEPPTAQPAASQPSKLSQEKQPENSGTGSAETSAPNAAASRAAEPSFFRTDNLITIAIALLLAIVIRIFIAEPRYIPSDSMVPTLAVGDRLVIEKISPHYRPPHMGEIVIFTPPDALQAIGYDAGDVLIKRVIGTPGHQIEIRDGQVYRDQEKVQEPYIAAPPNYNLRPVTVPEDTYLMLGDNRNNSNDSHIWGFLPSDRVRGRAIFRFWPPQRIGMLTGEATYSQNSAPESATNPDANSGTNLDINPDINSDDKA